MAPKKRFSTFIMGSLSLIMGISIVLAATGVYVFRIRQMTHDTNAILETSGQGFANVLSNQLEYVGTEIDAVAADAAIIESIETGDHQRLLDTVAARFATGAARQIVFYDQRRGRFIPSPSGDMASLLPTMEALISRGKTVTHFQRTDNGKFITIFSAPVTPTENRIGTVYLLYSLSRDIHFWNLMETPNMTFSRILIKSGQTRLYDIRTEEEIVVSNTEKVRALSPSAIQATDICPGEILMPLPSFPNLYYAEDDGPRKDQRQAIILVLAWICAAVLLVTFCIAFFIARIVSKPLEKMANEAIKIAQNPSAVGVINEETVEYLEFRQLARAFNQVLSSLFSAQEKLKSEAGEEKKRLEAELHRAMKMEAVGAMAGGGGP